MEWVLLVRWLHIIGAAVLFGTGAGIAFFMLMAHRTRDPRIIAHVAASVVVADTIFTATAVVVQPVTGALLAQLLGWDLATPWIVVSLCLYVLTGLCWLPVVWLQLRLRDEARAAAAANAPLSSRYYRLFRWWFVLGWPAFAAVLGILWLMVTRPAF